MPTFLIWGDDLTLFWHEVWEVLGPYVRRALRGKSFAFENYAAALDRYGHTGQAWSTFSYSPLRDEQGAVRGGRPDRRLARHP